MKVEGQFSIIGVTFGRGGRAQVYLGEKGGHTQLGMPCSDDEAAAFASKPHCYVNITAELVDVHPVSIQDIADDFAALSDAATKASEALGRVEPPSISATCLAAAAANGGVSASELFEATGADKAAVKKALRELVASGLLRTEGVKRGCRYFAVQKEMF